MAATISLIVPAIATLRRWNVWACVVGAGRTLFERGFRDAEPLAIVSMQLHLEFQSSSAIRRTATLSLDRRPWPKPAPTHPSTRSGTDSLAGGGIQIGAGIDIPEGRNRIDRSVAIPHQPAHKGAIPLSARFMRISR